MRGRTMRNQLCDASRKNNGKEKESSKEEEALSFILRILSKRKISA